MTAARAVVLVAVLTTAVTAHGMWSAKGFAKRRREQWDLQHGAAKPKAVVPDDHRDEVAAVKKNEGSDGDDWLDVVSKQLEKENEESRAVDVEPEAEEGAEEDDVMAALIPETAKDLKTFWLAPLKNHESTEEQESGMMRYEAEKVEKTYKNLEAPTVTVKDAVATLMDAVLEEEEAFDCATALKGECTADPALPPMGGDLVTTLMAVEPNPTTGRPITSNCVSGELWGCPGQMCCGLDTTTFRLAHWTSKTDGALAVNETRPAGSLGAQTYANSPRVLANGDDWAVPTKPKSSSSSSPAKQVVEKKGKTVDEEEDAMLYDQNLNQKTSSRQDKSSDAASTSTTTTTPLVLEEEENSNEEGEQDADVVEDIPSSSSSPAGSGSDSGKTSTSSSSSSLAESAMEGEDGSGQEELAEKEDDTSTTTTTKAVDDLLAEAEMEEEFGTTAQEAGNTKKSGEVKDIKAEAGVNEGCDPKAKQIEDRYRAFVSCMETTKPESLNSKQQQQQPDGDSNFQIGDTVTIIKAGGSTNGMLATVTGFGEWKGEPRVTVATSADNKTRSYLKTDLMKSGGDVVDNLESAASTTKGQCDGKYGALREAWKTYVDMCGADTYHRSPNEKTNELAAITSSTAESFCSTVKNGDCVVGRLVTGAGGKVTPK